MAIACAALGLLGGIVAGLPLVLALRAGHKLEHGLAGIGFSFLVLMAVIAAERALAGPAFVGYAIIAVLVYLGIVTVSGLRHARTLG